MTLSSVFFETFSFTLESTFEAAFISLWFTRALWPECYSSCLDNVKYLHQIKQTSYLFFFLLYYKNVNSVHTSQNQRWILLSVLSKDGSTQIFLAYYKKGLLRWPSGGGLLLKHESLCFVSKTHVKSWSVTCTCYSGARKQAGGSLELAALAALTNRGVPGLSESLG